ncbi:Crp/Fnr family transcriptional regulator [Foetidibacter luteolus]|uniref:Crp/Fnr family transcriptional regulator n=1 Tax=Foetidibacter luteolus TaxID=2608880 RepID=UPI00129B231F|nr:Crp/Fnr family transcriptional regulator [Foetidibacter luteolus]
MKEYKAGCDVKSCLLCKLCLKEWLPAVAANRKNFQFKKGELLFKEGDEMTGIYFVYSGTVKVHKRWDKDKELILRFAKKGDIVGHRGLGKDNFFPISATALEPVTACFIDIEFFLSSLKVNHNFLFELMMFYAAELKHSERNMRNLAHMPVKGRIAQALLLLQEKFGVNSQGCIDITLSRQDLASFVGATYETVFRTINELVDEQLVTIMGKDIAITNRPALENLLGEQ